MCEGLLRFARENKCVFTHRVYKVRWLPPSVSIVNVNWPGSLMTLNFDQRLSRGE